MVNRRGGWSRVVGRLVGLGRSKLGVGVLVTGVTVLLVAAASPTAGATTPNPPGDGVVVTPSGLVLPVREIQDGGYRVTTTCWKEGLVTAGTYIAGVDVVIDPGHGGVEHGAVGANRLSEKDLNLAVARLAATEIRAHGYSVLLTRTTDVRIPVVVRAEIARALDPYVFVSIHHNGGAKRRSTDPGTEIYHQADNPQSARLAGVLYEQIHTTLSPYDIAWRDTVFQGANAVVRKRDGKDLYGILQYTPGMASVITEAAYLSNPPEARLLADPDVQAAEAKAIAHGIVRYLTTDHPGSGYNGTFTSTRTLYTGGTGGCVDPPHGTEPPTETTPEHEDTPTSIHQPAIEELATQGVLRDTECGPHLFCPTNPIQRWVLAVWLVRVLDHNEPEPIATSRFTDIDATKWWAPHVERLATLGITHGCDTNPARYCPHSYVARDQMASFIARAFQLEAGQPAGYVDTANNPHAPNIDAATTAGIIHGCDTNPARYCPYQPTTRAQAAALVHRSQHPTP